MNIFITNGWYAYDINVNVVKTYELKHQFTRHSPIQTVVDELRGLDNDMQCPTRADNAIRTSEVLESIRNGGRTYTMDGVVKAEWNVTYKRIVMPGEGYTGGNKLTNG
jgi:hypothetical protein